MDAEVVIDQDDKLRRLAEVKMALDIATAAYALWFIFDMTTRGKISYLVSWHVARYRRQLREAMERDRQWRISLGRMFYEVDHVLRESTNG